MQRTLARVLSVLLVTLSATSASAQCTNEAIYVVGGNWCGPCHTLRSTLESLGVPYGYIEAVPNPYDQAAWDRIETRFHQRSIPILAIDLQRFIVAPDINQIRSFVCR